MSGEIKGSFSPMALDLVFDFGSTTLAPTLNYARIPALGRYYFIDHWTFSGGLWIASLVVDVLATYKTQIGASTQYVARAYSDYDPTIIDTTYLTHARDLVIDHSSLTPGEFWGAEPWANDGLIVVGIIGNSSGAIGPTSYYAMSIPVFNALISSMLSNISWAGINPSEISEELQKALINPLQYIVSAYWYPVYASSFSQGVIVNTCKVGYWSFSLAGNARLLTDVGSAWITRTGEMKIPHHYQSGGRERFLDLSPFSEYTLKVLPFGVFNVDSTQIFGKEYLGLRIEYNLMSGDAVLTIAARDFTGSHLFDDAPIEVITGKVGVPIPLAQITIDASNYNQGLLGAAAGAAQGISAMLGGG